MFKLNLESSRARERARVRFLLARKSRTRARARFLYEKTTISI